MNNCKKCFDSATDAYTEFLKLKLKCETLERENAELKRALEAAVKNIDCDLCPLFDEDDTSNCSPDCKTALINHFKKEASK